MTGLIGQLAAEGSAVIGDLEMEISKMDAEIRMLEKELKRAEGFKPLADKYSTLWRNHLNGADIDGDNEYESEARQILWDDGDAEKLSAAEDYNRDAEATTAAWNE